MDGARDEKAAAAREPFGHQDGFGRGSGTVVHGSVGDFLAGKLAHQGLKLEDSLQRALCDFRLIRSVRGEKIAALNDGIRDYGTKMVINAGAEKARVSAGILRCAGFEKVDDFRLGERAGQIECFAKSVTLRNA